MPVPDSGTVTSPPEVRLSAKDKLPEKLLAESGRKTTWKDTLCPNAKVVGKAGLASINSGELLEA